MPYSTCAISLLPTGGDTRITSLPSHCWRTCSTTANTAATLMVALVSRFNMTEMFSKEDFTMVKNPGKENMEIITKEGQEIKKYTPSEDQKTSGKRGKKVGVAYQLENGEIIYVPE